MIAVADSYTENMSPTAEELLRKALSLDENDRASIAGALIESLHGEPDPDAEDTWDMEIQRRVQELDSGKVETIPWTEVRKRLSRGREALTRGASLAETPLRRRDLRDIAGTWQADTEFDRAIAAQDQVDEIP